jgi:DNA-binding CsgD family transcriptional regulator
VLLANAQFEAEDGGWTLRGGDRIAVDDDRTGALLADALLDAVMHLVPIRGAAHDLFSRTGAIVVITRSSGTSGGPALLQSLFDLTPTEAAIARRLSQGETAEQIAQATQKSVLTIRTQLKSVLAKTGTRRQSELMHLLTRLVPPAL